MRAQLFGEDKKFLEFVVEENNDPRHLTSIVPFIHSLLLSLSAVEMVKRSLL
jgi:hypothetical protein